MVIPNDEIDFYIRLANSAQSNAAGADQNQALGRLCFGALELIMETKGARCFSIPSAPVNYDASIDADGNFQCKPSLLWLKYMGFLNVLEQIDVRGIGRCPQCRRFFYGRTNQLFCTASCRTRHWQAANPDAVDGHEEKRNHERKVKRRANRKRREAEQVRRLEEQVPLK